MFNALLGSPDAWLHGMEEDNMAISINCNDELDGVESEPMILIDDLLDEEQPILVK